MLSNVGVNQVSRNRRYLVEACLAELPLHIVFIRKAKGLDIGSACGQLGAAA